MFVPLSNFTLIENTLDLTLDSKYSRDITEVTSFNIKEFEAKFMILGV